MAEKDFKDFCSEFEILFFQETWVSSMYFPPLPGYAVYTTPASKPEVRGRARGGLATLISVDSNPVILELDMGLGNNILILQVT